MNESTRSPRAGADRRAVGVPEQVATWVRAAARVVVLTGAGMSAESGVATFRDPQVGLWEQWDPMVIASVDGWAADRDLVFGWYLGRIAAVRRAVPNPGHVALAAWAGRVRVDIVTQNVDDLHERAGSASVSHLHGALEELRCSVCDAPYAGELTVPDEPVLRVAPPVCPDCGGAIRPGVVWFGELLPRGVFDTAMDLCRRADLVLVVGTSGIVQPAAMLPDLAAAEGVPVVEVNPVRTALSDRVDHSWRTTAALGLPLLVDVR